MRKTVLLLFVLTISSLCLFATSWREVSQIDDFGDPTGAVIIISDDINIQYGNYSYTKADCNVIVAKLHGQFVPGFSLANSTYDEWTIHVKQDDGTTFTITGQGPGAYVFNNSNATKLINAMKKGCKIVVQPTNKYSNYKFNFGQITITDADLAKVKEN